MDRSQPPRQLELVECGQLHLASTCRRVPLHMLQPGSARDGLCNGRSLFRRLSAHVGSTRAHALILRTSGSSPQPLLLRQQLLPHAHVQWGHFYEFVLCHEVERPLQAHDDGRLEFDCDVGSG